VDETEYRQTYRVVNERRCVFEKAVNARRCTCHLSQRFNLADREGVSCTSETGSIRCKQLLDLLRQNAKFSLQMTNVPGPLPHAKEVKVQIGGMLGLQKLLHPQMCDEELVHDINGLANAAVQQYSSLDNLPYSEIVKSIVTFEGRLRRRSRKDK
jgi:hypothetical protein